jgi:hypothetical protein
MANRITRTPGDAYDMWYQFDGSGGLSGYGRFNVGYSYDTDRTLRGALRFENVQIAKNATGIIGELRMYAYEKVGDKQIATKVWGIDEDNTSSFTSSPLGRTKTSASNTHTTNVSSGSYYTIGCGNVVEEIVSRSKWSPGNAMGFIVEDNGTSHDESGGYLYDQWSDPIDSYFEFRVGDAPNFNPTPKSVAAPSFPSAESFGLKISYPGYDVLSANEQQLYYSSRKRSHKIVSEGVINTTANTTYNIAHGLGYIPFCLAYAKETGSTKRYKIPRYLPIALFQDQFGSLDTTNGTVEVDSSNLKITTTSNCEVYYRIFIDQL